MNNKAFEALANDTRRKLLVELLEENPLADNLQLRTDGGGRMLQKKKNEQLQMHHQHLPKLVDYGFIQWDKERHQISKGPKFEEIQPLLEWVRTHS